MKRPPMTREERKALHRRRHDRRFRRCEPVNHEPPWVKYSRRARPSELVGHNAAALDWLRQVFDPIYRAAKRAQRALGG